MNMSFELDDFLPYHLNKAAVRVSADFAKSYKSRHGLLPADWRVLAHLGTTGPMTARQICAASGTHKTKISRAVYSLERRRWLKRASDNTDRRREWLSLTKAGQRAFDTISIDAQKKTQRLKETLGDDNYKQLLAALKTLTD